MTDTEIFLLCFIVFQQVMLFLLIGLQKRVNETIQKVLRSMMDRNI